MRWLGVVLVLWLVSCDQEPEALEVEKVAKNFLNAYTTGNIDQAAEWVTAKGEAHLTGLQHDLDKFFITHYNQYVWAGVDEVAADTMTASFLWDTSTVELDTIQLLLIKDKKRWRVDFERIDPVGVARMFLSAFHKNDLELAANYVTPAAKHDLTLIGEMFARWEGPETVITGMRYDDTGDKAVVLYREAGSLLEKKLNLINYKGLWRVAFTKFPEFEDY